MQGFEIPVTFGSGVYAMATPEPFLDVMLPPHVLSAWLGASAEVKQMMFFMARILGLMCVILAALHYHQRVQVHSWLKKFAPESASHEYRCTTLRRSVVQVLRTAAGPKLHPADATLPDARQEGPVRGHVLR